MSTPLSMTGPPLNANSSAFTLRVRPPSPSAFVEHPTLHPIRHGGAGGTGGTCCKGSW
jgi:hypothetical protein